VPRFALALLVAGLLGCSRWPEPTSVSSGLSSRGALIRPRAIPISGDAWEVPDRWEERGFHYGTEELVEAVMRAARAVDARAPPGRLGVADFSRLQGGASQWHHSHHSGRDVDLLFYSVDRSGKVLPPPQSDMLRYDAAGRAIHPEGSSEAAQGRVFDARRNWMLVEALLTDPTIRIQWIFVSEALEQRMLAYASEAARPRWVRAYAELVMQQPGDSAPHNDHFHVRVYCTRGDRQRGCEDRGPVWQHEKKTYKYGGPERFDPVLWRRLAVDPG